ncbi:hypothetical protein A3K93_01160 [Acinetobacter sp. NCu2D-2]|uniref:hypothetical protein n=1 Tax=Acinetobacter sp. NCu2D-2 TaxID=1608473 RepID=UPI0007CE01CA|nr:hypothetical protein [Acinetobacter sp. NCu2D-2]ANF80930.1 hypothetical protein A3K93_01160 [Acinetobacter sp. NCu2D-2]
MSIKKTILFSTALLVAFPSFAQNTENTDEKGLSAPIRPYGDNPNLLHVFAYKAQQGVINGVEKVDELAEKGIAKVKPSVDRVWGNTKSTASNTIQQVDQGVQSVTQQANQKIQDTKQAITGASDSPVPIESQPLSQSSNTTQTVTPQSSSNSSSGATSYVVTDL